MSITFADLPLRPETQAALAEHGFKSPFPIQEMVLPIALGDGDVIGQAKTGTGKTLAFGIPLIERVIAPLDKEWEELAAKGLPQVLVVVPTRELCVQVTKDIAELVGNRGVRVLAVYGGRAFEPQIEALETMTLKNPSPYFRRTLWQIINAMKEGAASAEVMSNVITNL